MDLWFKQEADAYGKENHDLQEENAELRQMVTRQVRMLHAEQEITRGLRAEVERLNGMLRDTFEQDPFLHSHFTPAAVFEATGEADFIPFLG
jgi:hypothetical protein